MLTVNLALSGLAVGAVAALSGVGLLVTYRLTGVLNVAQGALATVAAYLVWALVFVCANFLVNSRMGAAIGEMLRSAFMAMVNLLRGGLIPGYCEYQAASLSQAP